jgi:integrase/recombinase XerD
MTVPPGSSPRCLRLEEWPEPDQRAWRRASHDGDLLEDSGLLANLRPISLAHYRSAYGRWLWHVTTMHPDALREEPAARITRERADGYVGLLRRSNAPLTVVDRLRGLKRVAHAMAPSTNWRWLDRMVGKVSARARPARDKRSRMRPPDEVFRAALDLLATAESGCFTSDTKRALAYRDGLLLAVAASRAPRVGNLGMMEVGRHLQRVGANWVMSFSGGETKNGDPLELQLPEELTGPFERYLAHWRPILLAGRASNRLWVSMHRRPLDAKSIHGVFCERTRRLFGQPLNPHLLRACLMTETAIRDPGHVGIASPILGHRASGTGTRHYNLAGQHEAARQWQQLALKLRDGARQRTKGRR